MKQNIQQTIPNGGKAVNKPFFSPRSPAIQLEAGEGGGLLSAEERSRALSYTPQFRPRTPRTPTIPAPPVPARTPRPTNCPSAADKRWAIDQISLRSETIRFMQRAINGYNLQSRQQLTQSMIRRADHAIRRAFGNVLPAGRNYADQSATTTLTPDQFAQRRVPNAARAKRRIGQAALETSAQMRENGLAIMERYRNNKDTMIYLEAQRDVLFSLHNQCVTSPTDPVLVQRVVNPIFQQFGLAWVRNYEKANVGGQTRFPKVGGQVRPHVDLPSESRNMGHIVVHEAMHFYVHPDYHQAAIDFRKGAIEDELMEGGAEFLTRHVIRNHLRGQADFSVRSSTYSEEFWYIASEIMRRGGLSTFKLAYFQGNVGLIGL